MGEVTTYPHPTLYYCIQLTIAIYLWETSLGSKIHCQVIGKRLNWVATKSIGEWCWCWGQKEDIELCFGDARKHTLSHVIMFPRLWKGLKPQVNIHPISYDCCQHWNYSHSFSMSLQVPGIFGSWVMSHLPLTWEIYADVDAIIQFPNQRHGVMSIT